MAAGGLGRAKRLLDRIQRGVDLLGQIEEGAIEGIQLRQFLLVDFDGIEETSIPISSIADFVGESPHQDGGLFHLVHEFIAALLNQFGLQSRKPLVEFLRNGAQPYPARVYRRRGASHVRDSR